MNNNLERRYMYLFPTQWAKLYALAKAKDTNIAKIITLAIDALEQNEHDGKRQKNN